METIQAIDRISRSARDTDARAVGALGHGPMLTMNAGPAPAVEDPVMLIDECGLTDREVEVVVQLCRGRSTRQIATALFISPHTVHDHVKAVFGKVGVRSRAELLATLFAPHVDCMVARLSSR